MKTVMPRPWAAPDMRSLPIHKNVIAILALGLMARAVFADASAPAPPSCGKESFALEATPRAVVARCAKNGPCPTEATFTLTSCSNLPLKLQRFEICGPPQRGTCRPVTAPRVLLPRARVTVRVVLDLLGSYEAELSAAPGGYLRAPVSLVDAVGEREFKACILCRGDWGRHGMHVERESCLCRTRDAGRLCTASSDCEVRCEFEYGKALARQRWRRDDPTAPRGWCSEYYRLYGCHAWFVDEPRPDGSMFESLKWLCVD